MRTNTQRKHKENKCCDVPLDDFYNSSWIIQPLNAARSWKKNVPRSHPNSNLHFVASLEGNWMLDSDKKAASLFPKPLRETRNSRHPTLVKVSSLKGIRIIQDSSFKTRHFDLRFLSFKIKNHCRSKFWFRKLFCVWHVRFWFRKFHSKVFRYCHRLNDVEIPAWSARRVPEFSRLRIANCDSQFPPLTSAKSAQQLSSSLNRTHSEHAHLEWRSLEARI